MATRLMMEVPMSAISLRTDFNTADVRSLVHNANDPNQMRRLLVIGAVHGGMGRAKAALAVRTDRLPDLPPRGDSTF